METIDDACAFAWAQFMRYQPDRDRNWRGWLFRVAQREAWKLDAIAKQTVPYEPQDTVEARVGTVHQVASRGNPQWERVELNAEILAALPPRIRQVAVLRATRTGYKEIAEVTGDAERTVHRLMRRRERGDRRSRARGHAV